MSSYTELKNQVIAGKVTRTDLINMVLSLEQNHTQSFVESLVSLTDGQLIDMICIKD